MELLGAPCDGVIKAADVDYSSFTIRVTAAGAKGYSYTCDAAYDPTTGTADKECAGWLPSQVVDGEEDLDVTLEALDAGGKRAMCMQWRLAFGAAPAAGAWRPADAIGPDPAKSAADFFAAKFPQRVAAPRDVPGFGNDTGGANNTPATRNVVAQAYLDSMTYVSHACVPKSVNDILYPTQPLPYGGDMYCAPGSSVCVDAFPPGVIMPALLRVAHKALAISGTIHSIDRKCKEAWRLGKGSDGTSSESCVSFPYLHCHTQCDMTWHLGPGGVASWGMTFLNHQIPSPSIIIAQQLRKNTNDKTFGDLGCGGGDVPPPAQYRCKDGKCVATAGGVDIDTCRAAC